MLIFSSSAGETDLRLAFGALIHLERIEHVSEIYWRVKMLGNVKRAPPEAQAQLIELREKYFKG